MLRGGFRPIDIYRRGFAGINGTPMPSFSLLLNDTLWHLVNYVEYLSDTRRREWKAAGLIRRGRLMQRRKRHDGFIRQSVYWRHGFAR